MESPLENDPPPSEPVKLARRRPPEPIDTLPEDENRMPRAEAMRALCVGAAKLAAMVTAGELRAWTLGRDTIYERSEVEAIAGRDGQATVLGEAVKLLKQSHAHNADAMRLMMGAAQAFASLSKEIVTHLLERNEKLERVVSEQRDTVAKAHAEETQQAVLMLQTEAELERQRALWRAGERALPVLMARITGTPVAKDAALASALRAFASHPELVEKLRSGLDPTEAAQFTALVTAAQEPAA